MPSTQPSDGGSAEALRTFLNITTRKQNNKLGSLEAAESAVILKCNVGGGKIGKGCVG